VRRFLVVGCGGSGGATLAYLMDQLRSDLMAYGVDRLPQGWQFVHIDVPNTSDRGPSGLGSVEEQGGAYFGCGPTAAAYSVLDTDVSRRLAGAAAADAIATWAPRDPEKVTNPISDGAGQYRAVGRMISLSRASAIRSTLQTVWDRLGRPDTKSEMRGLRVPGLGPYDDNTPIVLMVSSMAGGAGASMALDVCRLLTLNPQLDPKLMGVFMVTPNIFDALPDASRTGVRPNALAMLGEIVASQTGAARRHDVEILRALGQPGGEGVPIPFARVFPVGRFAGVDRTQFGDGSPEAVYRGLGRGLAGLIMSEAATTQFVRFDLGNTASPNGDRSLLGWGSKWEDLPWGSYGFASLSMGRDRYREYAAQRIARSCVERLLHGHIQPDDRASSNEQVAALLESQWVGVCRRAGLPPTENDVAGWLKGYAFPEPAVQAEARALVQTVVEPQIPNPDGLQAAQWVPALRHRMSALSPDVRAKANAVATRLAFDWHQRLLSEVEQVVAAAIAELGLPYAVAIVDRLARHGRELIGPAADRRAALPRPDVTAIPARVDPLLSKLKGPVRNGRQLVRELLDGCRENVALQIDARAAEYVSKLLPQFAIDVLDPLRQALGEAQLLLENAVDAGITDRGLARLATEQVPAWPSDEDQRVPSRFDEADNEVLLTSSVHFMPQYLADVRRAIAGQGAPHFEDARAQVVRQVVAGEWATTGGRKAPGGLLQRRAEWRSRVFQDDPNTGLPIIPAHTNYDVHVRAGELLARARLFVDRPGESFDRFCRLSITDFVRGADAKESEVEQRRSEVLSKFIEALTLARPLISVNNTALQAVHGGSGIVYRYKFSEVPFQGLVFADDLVRVLQTDPDIDQPSVENLERAVTDTAGVTRVDIFGSYPNYSPLVFDAVLGPVAEQWAAVGNIGRESFWQWRRARPLDAALPMGDNERRAMVAGWLLGQIIGHIRIPGPPFTQPVQIWDGGTHWVSFPDPLLTPPSRFLAKYDWLPAVLESVLIAIARAHDTPVMESLRPYKLLRGIFDDASQDPAGGITRESQSARRNIAAWLTAPGGSGRDTSSVVGADAAATVEERAKLATEWLTRIRDLAGEHYMAAGQDGAPGHGAYSRVDSRELASATPMFRDIAPDVWWATQELMRLIDEERLTAHRPVAIPDGPPSPPASGGTTIPTPPDIGTF
jgi:hypothetical protein